MFNLSFCIRMIIAAIVSFVGIIVILLFNINPSACIPGFITGAFGFQIVDYIIFNLRQRGGKNGI